MSATTLKTTATASQQKTCRPLDHRLAKELESNLMVTSDARIAAVIKPGNEKNVSPEIR